MFLSFWKDNDDNADIKDEVSATKRDRTRNRREWTLLGPIEFNELCI